MQEVLKGCNYSGAIEKAPPAKRDAMIYVRRRIVEESVQFSKLGPRAGSINDDSTA